MRRFSKTITDPVHGNISLTSVEAEIMTSAVMQRLHNVRQLGLAHLVYPGANYSRFAHSIGACHNASNLIEAVSRNSGTVIPEKAAQEYRIVALLHDIGHYPFSHAMEHVVEEHYARGLVSPTPTRSAKATVSAQQSAAPTPTSNVTPLASGSGPVPPLSYDHEPLGEQIIRKNPELAEIMVRHDIDPATIADKFAKVVPDPLIGIISSDLDCDRLDYLKRTAHNSGAPYGSVDIRFLIDQATVDDNGTFCFHPKAARAADHLLVSRYFDYMQVPYNKTVAALEWSLVTSLRALLERGIIDCSSAAVDAMIVNGLWNHFDDQKLMGHFRELASEIRLEPKEAVLHRHLQAVLDRRPAKLIAGWDEVMPRRGGTSTKNEFIADRLREEVAKDLSLDINRLHIWTTKPVLFSKANGSVDPGYLSEEDIAEAVQILDTDQCAAKLLVHRKDSLVSQLSSFQMSGLRLYYLPEENELDPALRLAIVARFSKALGPPVIAR